jgi:hypothetical protein
MLLQFLLLAAPKAHFQEETVVVKPSPVPSKKKPTAPPSESQKRGDAAAASLEVHQSSASSDNVSIASCIRLYLFLSS